MYCPCLDTSGDESSSGEDVDDIGCLQYESDVAALQRSAVNGCIEEPGTICTKLKGADFAAARSYGKNSFWMQASTRLGQLLVGLVAFFYLRPHGSMALSRQPGATGK